MLEHAADAHRDDLVRAAAGELDIAEPDAARRRPRDAGDAVQQRALAGAVRADEPDDAARGHRERDVLERVHAAEAHADVVHHERGGVHAETSRGRR
jgi:hypothetical protein